MSVDRILQLKLIGDVGSLNKDLSGTQSRLGKLGKSAASWTKAFAFGIAIEGIEAVGSALGDALQGFRDGERVAAQLGNTWNNLGLDSSGLAKAIEEISASTRALGTSDDEAIKAFNNSLKSTGDSAESMRRLKIAQDLVASGSAPNLTAAMKLIQQAANGSKGVVDKFGLTAGTAGGRIKELGERVKGAAGKAAELDPLGVAINGISEDLETIVGSFSTGDIEGALGGLASMGDTLSTAWGKVYDAVVPALDKMTGGAFSGFAGMVQGWLDRLSRLADEILPDVQSALQGLVDIWGKLQPAVQGMWDAVQPIINAVETSIRLAFDNIRLAIGVVKDLLNGDFTAAFEGIKQIGANVWEALQGFVEAFKTFFSGAVTTITDIAGRIGQGIWDGIVGTVTGIAKELGRIIQSAVDAVVGAARDMVNTILGLWNQLDFGIPAGKFQFWGASRFGEGTIFDITVPEFALSWAGSGDLIPDIPLIGGGGRNQMGLPGYEKGLWNVPFDNMLALLHQGETVVPADFADEYRRNGGMGGGGASYTINISAMASDPAAVGREVVRAIRAYEQRDGRAWRS